MIMKKNMGKADKIIRLIIAVLFIGLFMAKIVTGRAGVALLVLAFVFIATSFISFCPLYTIFGGNTCSKKEA
jgi:hypothetical protein